MRRYFKYKHPQLIRLDLIDDPILEAQPRRTVSCPLTSKGLVVKALDQSESLGP